MRITENILTEKYLYNQKRIQEKILKTQTQLTTNNKLQKLTDSLGDSLDAIRLDSQIRRTEAYQKNISNAKDFVDASIRSLENVGNEIQKIISQVVNVDNPINDKNIVTVGLSIKSSFEAVVNFLNEKHNGMYLFGGTDFTNKPWSIDADGKAVSNSTNVTGEIKVQLTDNIKETMNVTGDKIQNTDVLNTINEIIDAFNAGTLPDRALTDRLVNAYKEVLSVQALAGEKYNRLDDIGSMMNNHLDNRKTMLADKMEIDPAQLSVELQYQDYLLQMSYKLASQILPKSILDYV